MAVMRESFHAGLRVKRLSKSFRSPAGESIAVLRNVSFEASSSESIAIVGPSGAGKTTLLHLLGGLELPDAGNIELNGAAIPKLSNSALAHLRNRSIGFVFQSHNLLNDFSAVENVALPLMIARQNRQQCLNRATAALEILGLTERMNHMVSYLSGGEQQRVALARALIMEPALVLADEPTGDLDETLAQEVSRRLISYASERNKLLIVATHNQGLAQMCDRVMQLKDGILEG